MPKILESGYVEDKKIFKEYFVKDFLCNVSYGRLYLVESRMDRIRQLFVLKVLDKDIRLETCGAASVMEIQSDRLIRIHDYGETVKHEACILTGYVRDSLENVLENGKAENEKKACKYFLEILKGLKVLEENDILHGDINPGNLFVVKDIIKIGDFEAAKCIPDKYPRGTLHYMPPEYFQGKPRPLGDRWSAAVIFHRMLTGCFAFGGMSYFGISGNVMLKPPNMKGIPIKYHPFFSRCFQKVPRHRHGAIEEMLEEAERICRVQ